MSPRSVLVTGSSRGIGAEIAAAFVARGDRVALHGRDREALDGVAHRLGDAVTIHIADVTDEADVARLGNEVGEIDVLIHNAGGSVGGFGPVESLDAAIFRAALEANLTSTFLVTKAFLPVMKARQHGVIVTMSSTVARQPSAQSPIAYAAAKAGVEAFTRALATQAGPAGVRVNCIAPETILTDRNRARIPSHVQAQLAASHPLGRLGLPADVASLAVFLASEDATWITGQVIELSGGATLR